MKIENTIPCIVCKTPLDNLEYESQNGSKVEVHPMYGLHFTSYGHYGSTIFDPMGTGEKLDIVICDKCLKDRMEHVYEGVNEEYKAELEANQAEMEKELLEHWELKDD
jgi:hypothetical protein